MTKRFKVTGSIVRMAVAQIPLSLDAPNFLQVGHRGLETHHVFLRSP